MKALRKLGAAVVLTSILGLPALAGEVLTPPCAPPVPGEVLTPPCTAAPGDPNTSEATSTTPGDTGTAALANNDTSLGDIATGALLNFLSLY